MKTIVVANYRDPGHYYFIQTVAHWLTETESNAIRAVLRTQHLPIVVTTDSRAHTVHLWPQRSMSTAEEVAALRAFAAVTDSRLAWHPAVA